MRTETKYAIQRARSRTTIGFLVASLASISPCCDSLVRGQPVVDPAATHEIPPFTIPAAQPDVAYERFLVIGDMGTGRPDQKLVAAAMAKRAESDGLDFWITTGDNFYPDGVQSADDPQWRTKFEQVYDHSALQVPIYPCLGNHDHRGNVDAQIEYAGRNRNWKMSARYYSFTRVLDDKTTVQFIALDTDPLLSENQGNDAQLAWLDEQLTQSDARWTIVYGHHPLYGHHPRRGHNQTLIEKLEPILAKHKVDVYFAGHDHSLEMIKPIKGVHYVISGAGGGPDWAYSVNWTDESYYVATGGGFVLCLLSKDELVLEFVRLDGSTQYAHVLRK